MDDETSKCSAADENDEVKSIVSSMEEYRDHSTLPDLDGDSSTSFFDVPDGDGGVKLEVLHCSRQFHNNLAKDPKYAHNLATHGHFRKANPAMDDETSKCSAADENGEIKSVLSSMEQYRDVIEDEHSTLPYLDGDSSTSFFDVPDGDGEVKLELLHCSRQFHNILAKDPKYAHNLANHGHFRKANPDCATTKCYAGEENNRIKLAVSSLKGYHYETENDKSGSESGMEDCKEVDDSPRNTVSCSLNGTSDEICTSYEEAIIHLIGYNKRFGTVIDYSSVLGKCAKLITTPPEGTFHFLMKYQEHGVSLIIDARTGWMYGFVNRYGIWYFKALGLPYIAHAGAKMLQFEAKYAEVSPGGNISNIEVGVDPVREAVMEMSEYKGQLDTSNLQIAVGRVIYPVCEGYKYSKVFSLNSKVFKSGMSTTVGQSECPESSLFVKGWQKVGVAANGSLCTFFYDGITMWPFDKSYGGIRTVEQVLNSLTIATYNSVPNKMLYRKSRSQFFWQRVDEGKGDEEICLLDRFDLSRLTLTDQLRFKRDKEYYLGQRTGGLAHPSIAPFLDSMRKLGLNPCSRVPIRALGPHFPPAELTSRVRLCSGTWPAKLARALKFLR